jgi:hypothetical protein
MTALLLLIAGLASPSYPWMAEHDFGPTVPLQAQFAPPTDFVRVTVAPGSFSAWLRTLPVRTDRTHVLAYNGDRLARPSAAIVALDVGKRDLQQCADTVIRLHAEYLWSVGKGAKAAYHFTSGDNSTWRAWQRGERFKIRGSKVVRVKRKRGNQGHAGYRRWLTHTFRYAGTQSLRYDSTPVGTRPYAAGDFFVQPGGPGHAVMLLDLAEHPDGRHAALIGQGFMPAEDLHVLTAAGDRVLNGVWFLLPDAEHPLLATPSWYPFEPKQARRFKQR